MMNKYALYETEKRKLLSMNLPFTEYQKRLKELIERLKI
jgi:hypothetical protein